ncbi:MAG: vanadium-dependent haloperoxidase [Pseudomonadota bacterium]
MRAAKTGKARHFEAIPLDGTASRRLANPQGAYRFVHGGLDGHATRMRPAPTFRSAEAAAEMGEVYWQGLTRDVPFNHYETDIRIANAVDDLNYGFSETVGPKMSGFVNPMTLFRGPTDGDLTGPYVSQFLWHDIPYGPSVINQRYERPVSHLEFMVDEVNWLNVQRGGAPMETPVFDTDRRYIYDNRGLGEYVHRDVLFQAYFNAGLILLGYGGAAIDSGNPYFNGTISNQGAFTCFGGPYMIDLVTQAGNLALQGAWYQKWLQHRRLRPEVYAGRVHFMMTGKRNYELNSEILNSQAVQHVYSQFGSYLLPMAYTEGSPTHPSYPAGHATVAGACTTMLKAFFNEEFVIPNPVISNDDGTALDSYYGATLTVGGELNKLASNVAIARNAAGVHYRSDGVDGLYVGEQQAIGLLKDYSLEVNEPFDGFTLTKFDGERVRISNGKERTA